MARQDNTKERRIEFLTATPEQKIVFNDAAEKEGISLGQLIRRVMENHIHGDVEINPAVEHLEKRIAELEMDKEKLQAALSQKKRANENVNEELREVRARLLGDLGGSERARIALEVMDLIQTAGTISRPELISAIQLKKDMPNIAKLLKDVEYRLLVDGKIQLLSGGDIQWIG